MSLVQLIVVELGESHKVFEGIEVSMIGSTREGSRAFFYDEIDLHLSLNFSERCKSIFSEGGFQAIFIL